MKTFKAAHRRVWQSAIALSGLSIAMLAGGAFSPIRSAGADAEFAFSAIDKNCDSTRAINRDIRIGFPAATMVRQLPKFADASQLPAIVGSTPYCQFPLKTIATSQGVKWGTPFAFPVGGMNEVLIIYLAEGQFLGSETWLVQQPQTAVEQYQRDSNIANTLRQFLSPAPQRVPFSGVSPSSANLPVNEPPSQVSNPVPRPQASAGAPQITCLPGQG